MNEKEFDRSIQLSIEGTSQGHPIFSDQIKEISSWLPITRLCIDFTRVPFLSIMQVLSLLPHVDSLIMIPPCPSQIPSSITLETDCSISELQENHVIHVTIELTSTITQVTFIIEYFPQMKSLAINCSYDIDPVVLLRSIMSRMTETSQLCSICLWLGQINDEILKKFHQTMRETNRVSDYSITRLGDRISLQWN